MMVPGSYVLPPARLPTLAAISLWYGLILIVLTAITGWANGDGRSHPAAPLLAGLQLLLIALLLASFFYLSRRSSAGLTAALLPLWINAGTVMIITFVPFSDLAQELRFRWNLPQYEIVVAEIANGALPVPLDGWVWLPADKAPLSAGGRIWVDPHLDPGQMRLFFFTHLEGPDQFSGYLYQKGGAKDPAALLFGGWALTVPKGGGWTFCRSG